MATVTVDYCGMSGTGRNVTEARQDATRQIERLVRDLSECPEIVRCGGWSALVYRDAYGWHSAIIGEPEGIRPGRPYGTSHSVEALRKDVIAHARAHVAQLAWSRDVTDDQAFFAAAGVRDSALGDLVSWANWQRRYAEARATGLDDNQAREVAGGM